MIRICHIADHLNGEVDGIYSHILDIIELTDKTKFEHYLCFQGNSKIEKEILDLGGKIISLPELNSKFPFIAIIKFYLLTKKFDFDIVQTHFIKSYIVVGLSNIFLRRKHIYNYHGLFINNEYYNIIQKLVYKLLHLLICRLGAVDEAIAPSRESENQLTRETKYFSYVSQYYNGADCAKKKTNVSNEILSKINLNDSFRLVYVGRIEEEKRVDRTIDLVRVLRKNNIYVHLYIIGSGTLIKEMTNHLMEQALVKNVTWLGVVTNPMPYFDYFDCLILTSDREGMPFVVWQAMACGLPIISSAVGGVTEVIKNSKCGFTFEKDNLSEAVEKVKLLVNNKSLRKEIGENGIRGIKEDYTLEKFEIFIENLYLKLYSKK